MNTSKISSMITQGRVAGSAIMIAQQRLATGDTESTRRHLDLALRAVREQMGALILARDLAPDSIAIPPFPAPLPPARGFRERLTGTAR